MKIVDDKFSLAELKKMAEKMFDNVVKAVVDVEQEKIALDGELHSDEEQALLEQGSKQENLWGINLYPGVEDESWIEFDSMINLRPSQDNRTRSVDDPKLRNKIIKIINKIIKK